MTIEHLSSLGGFEKGDTVRIVGERGQYIVRSASRSGRSPEGWLDLFGGPRGREAYRAVRPNDVALVAPRPAERLPIPGLDRLDVAPRTRSRPLRDPAPHVAEESGQSTLF